MAVGDITYGSEYVFNSGSTSSPSISWLDDTHFIVVYVDGSNSSYGTAVIGTVSGSTISYGSEYVFSPDYTFSASVAVLSSNKIAIIYRRSTAYYNIRTVVGTVTGNAISFGSFVSIYPDNSNYPAIAAIDESTYAVAGRSSLGSSVRICTVSGTNITAGSNNNFNSSLYNNIILNDSTHITLLYRNSSSGYGEAVVGTISGTSVSFGSYYTFNAGSTHDIAPASLSSTSLCVSYRDFGNSDRGTAVVGTISNGNQISFGSEYVFNSASTFYLSSSKLDSTNFITSFKDEGGVDYGIAVIGTVDGTTISYGSEFVFNSGTTNHTSISAKNEADFVVSFQDASNSSYGTAIIGEVETFVPYEATYTGSGTLSYSGAATTSLEVGETYTGSGTLTFSGAAVEEVGYVTDGSGVITYSGIGAVELELSYDGEGLITYSGATTQEVDYIASASGGITFSGAAVTGVPVDYVYRETVRSTFYPHSDTFYSFSNALPNSTVPTAYQSNSIGEKWVLFYNEDVGGGHLKAQKLYQSGTDEYGPTYTRYNGPAVDVYNRNSAVCLLTEDLGVAAYPISISGVDASQMIQSFSLGGANGIDITLNTETSFNSYEAYKLRMKRLDDDRFIMTYWSRQSGSSESSLYAVKGTVFADGSVWFGSEFLISSSVPRSENTYEYDLEVLDTTKFAVAYETSTEGVIDVFNCSGSISRYGTYNHGSYLRSTSLFAISSTEFGVVTSTWNGVKKATLSGGNISLGSTISMGIIPTFYIDTHYNDDNRLVVFHSDGGRMDYYYPDADSLTTFSNGVFELDSVSGRAFVYLSRIKQDVYVASFVDQDDDNKLKSAIVQTKTPHQLTGGITFTGESQLQSDFIYNPSGDVTFSGSATEEIAYFVTGSGSITYSGTADTYPELSYTPTGGITYSGDAQPYIELTMITGGSIAFSGSVLAQTDQVYFASGSIEFGGFAVIARDINETGSGTITFSGEVQGERDFAYETSGGITYSGEAMLQTDSYYVAAGGIEFSGSAPFETPTNFEYVTTGGIEFSGSAEQYIDFLRYEGSGSIAYSGSAVEVIGVIYNPSGSIEYLGEAAVERGFSYTGQGFITYSGIGPGEEFNKYAYIGSGNIHYSGVTVRQVDVYETGSGVITFTGEASLNVDIYKYTGAGLLEFGGAGTYVLLKDSKESITVESYISTKITVEGLITRKLTVESLL